VNAAGADGLFAGGGFHQLGVQAVAVLVTMILSGGLTAGILVAIRALLGVRGSITDELTGMDSSEHGEEAYHAGDLGEMGGSAGALGQGVVLIRPSVPEKAREVA
jgi:ammonium transporter, Amt family